MGGLQAGGRRLPDTSAYAHAAFVTNARVKHRLPQRNSSTIGGAGEQADQSVLKPVIARLPTYRIGAIARMRGIVRPFVVQLLQTSEQARAGQLTVREDTE